MKKHEFKRAWRELRIEAREAQATTTERYQSGCVSQQHEHGRVSLVIGFCGGIRSASALWFGRPHHHATAIRDLVNPARVHDTIADRLARVRLLRSILGSECVRIPQ